MKNDPRLPPVLVPILPCPQRSPICKLMPLPSDIAINPEQLLMFSLCGLRGDPQGQQSPTVGTAQSSLFLAGLSPGAAWAWVRVIY